MNETDDNGIFDRILEKYAINHIVDNSRLKGLAYAKQEFDRIMSEEFNTAEEKNIFIDLFFTQCLKIVSVTNDISGFWELISQWFHARKLESRNGNLSHDEKIALIHFCLNLRQRLREFIALVPLTEVEKLTEEHHRLMIAIWRMLFFEPFAALNLYWNPTHPEEDLAAKCKRDGYIGLVIASMFKPFNADDFDIDSEQLIPSSIPFCYKTIIAYWMVNTPYFNAEEKHRLKLMRYIPELCRAIIRHPEILSTMFFLTFVQEVMTGLWRGSYIGGNNIDALSAFGDFISFTINRAMPYPKPKLVHKDVSKGEKIRVGYLSRNFYKQAVSCYMVNRVVHHDPDKFAVYTFALGDYHDNVSDMFKEHSDQFERLENMTDFRGIVEKIQEKELDILIYTDIGMDPVTYIISGLQLAPIQCAMVGHGTSTGMPTIQYYISGDFESPDGQRHYREKLITLPNSGAAQYLPMTPDPEITRAELGIPEDAVVFISCANGIKHGYLRDNLFVEILKQAPNAWIVLKPFATHASIDRVFTERIISKARDAGVNERLLILPPIGQTKHVLGLLIIADVQLDSYPYGGWTTNMEALHAGLPIVTQEGELARSRWGAGLLRALGVSEGIAANEQEYIEWAVRLAQDSALRHRLTEQIKVSVEEVLFNGAAAQPAFEQALTEIYNTECRRTELEETARQTSLLSSGNKLKPKTDVITIATSLRPSSDDIQKIAMQTWLDAGFHVVSLNALDTIAQLKPKFPDIEFIATTRDGREQHGKPFIYFDDVLAYFANRDIPICGIISPDLCLLDKNFQEFVRVEASNSCVFGSRVDVDSLSSAQGQIYNIGFDYFFFDRQIIPYYPQQNFCLGLPWCDYWAVIVPLMRKFQVKRVSAPVTLHVKHPPSGDANSWLQFGIDLSTHFKPPFSLSAETMARYAEETLTIINKLSQEVSL
ncbi:hypothetical protein SDC9_13761 [bioreactor metagenome]|uniref:O-GlcNAc transferase C-terminal domain-containing protein n=1 Tax=bioreactor metagenome TaxID=1076179 RepID=A0A644TM56_9ZZZZ